MIGADENTQFNKIALPFVYALMSTNEFVQYTAVLNAVRSMADHYRIENCRTHKFMSDFEIAIHNSWTEAFPEAEILCCLFHLGQTIYRQMQATGLQESYNNPDNRELKIQSHMMFSLAFIPPDDLKDAFQLLVNNSVGELRPILNYL